MFRKAVHYVSQGKLIAANERYPLSPLVCWCITGDRNFQSLRCTIRTEVSQIDREGIIQNAASLALGL